MLAKKSAFPAISISTPGFFYLAKNVISGWFLLLFGQFQNQGFMGQLLSLSLTCLMPSKAGGGVVHRTCLNLFHLVWGGGGCTEQAQ